MQNTDLGAQPSDITVDGNIVEQVDNFVYLGSNQSSDIKLAWQSDRHEVAHLSHRQPCRPYDECGAIGTCSVCLPKSWFTKLILTILTYYACEICTSLAAMKDLLAEATVCRDTEEDMKCDANVW